MEYRGRIKLGGVQDGGKYASPTFVFDETKELEEVFGETDELKITLISDRIEDNFSADYKYYENGELVCIGDGVTAYRDGRKIKCLGKDCNMNCKHIGRFFFYIPETDGIYEIQTASYYNIVHISSVLQMLKNINKRLKGTQLTLKLVEEEKDGNVFYLLKLDSEIFPKPQPVKIGKVKVPEELVPEELI